MKPMIAISQQQGDESPTLLREMTWFESMRSRVRGWYQWQIRRRIPHLVWRNQDVDVSICIRVSTREQFETLGRVEAGLRELGFSFDTGYGCGGRDWEWDYCLKGPVTIRFRGVRRLPRVPSGQSSPEAAAVEKDLIFDHMLPTSPMERGN